MQGLYIPFSPQGKKIEANLAAVGYRRIGLWMFGTGPLLQGTRTV